MGQAVQGKTTLLSAQAHGSTQIRILTSGFSLAIGVQPLGYQCDHRMRRLFIELSAVSPLQTRHIPGVLDHGHLHTETNAQVGYAILTGVLDSGYLALHSTITKASRYQDCVHLIQTTSTVHLYILSVHIDDPNLGQGVDTSMHQ